MMHNFTLRFTAIAATWLFIALCPNENAYLAGVFGLGMAHYISSFLYSGRQIKEFARGERSRLALAVLLVVGFAIAAVPHSHAAKLVYYFALHHVFNEVYMGGRATSPDDLREVLRKAAAILFHLVAYFSVLVHEEYLVWSAPFLTPRVLAPWLFASATAYGVAIYGMRERRTSRERILGSGGEVAVLLVAGASLAGVIYVHYLDIVMYHFVLWSIFPLTRLRAARASNWQPALRFVATNAGLLFTSVLVGARYITPTPGGPAWMAFFLMSYLHITTAFAFSTSFPTWITRWFQVSPGLAPSPVAAGSSMTSTSS